MALGGHAQHGRLEPPGKTVAADQPVAFADEQVAHVQGDAHAPAFVQGGRAIAEAVAVFDVVVDERGLVEALDGQSSQATGAGENAAAALAASSGRQRLPPWARAS